MTQSTPVGRLRAAAGPRPRWKARLASRWPALRHGALAGLVLGGVCGALSVASPLRPLEESFDLWALFRLRGTRPPPDDIVLVTIDRQSSERISLPRDPGAYARCKDLRVGSVPDTHQKLPPPHLASRWPRCVHEQVLLRLAAAGARVIAMDVSFRARPPVSPEDARVEEQQDRALAQAIAAAGNVLIARRFDLLLRPGVDQPKDRREFLSTPSDLARAIEEASLGSAPFPLATGAFGRVDGFATFAATETPSSSLPALALHALMADDYAEFARLLARISPSDAAWLPPEQEGLREWKPLQAHSLLLRNLLRERPQVARALAEALDGPTGETIPARHRAGVRALLALYGGAGVRYFNLYGYPGTFASLSYAEVLSPAGSVRLDAVRGKTVIMGFSELTEPQQEEHYPTVYTNNAGIKLSGAELLATALANLANGDGVRPAGAPARFAVAAGLGLALMVALLALPPASGIAAGVALALGYVLIARGLFAREALWLPLLLPVAVQLPVGAAYALGHHLLDANRRREELRRLFGKFIPEDVIDGLLEKRAALDAVHDPVYGVCMATDAERFTSIAESMHPAQLARYLDRYLEAVFPPITGHQGTISDVIGDAVLAFWTGEDTDLQVHARAASAALELLASVDEFNAASPGARLPTRIGIASGPITTTAIGAFNHYVFRPVGDTVVTAARLQELNKTLGTRALAAEGAVRGLDGFLLRDVGTFVLRGKSVPTHVFEILSLRREAGAEQLQLCLEFALALDALRSGRRDDALERFRRTRQRYPQDGPTAFYVRWLGENPSWDGGVIPQP